MCSCLNLLLVFFFMALFLYDVVWLLCGVTNEQKKNIVAPLHVSISGPSEARVGDPVPLQCTTAPSNPPAEIKWMISGRQARNATSRTVVSPEGMYLCYNIHFHFCI